MCVCLCVCACVRVCVCACVRVRACVRVLLVFTLPLVKPETYGRGGVPEETS